MTSEIRSNTIKNRVGLGTVSYTDTGIIVSGIVTANSFSGPISGTTGTFSGDVDINGDLDVDGHTNLDNVSIAGVTTITGDTGNVRLDLHSTASGTGSQIKLHNDHATTYFGQAGDTTGDLLVYNESNTNIRFFTNGNNERLRIASDGRVTIANSGSGGTADVNADNFVVKNYTSSGSCGISILNADNLNSTLYFGNASDSKHAELVWSDAANLFLIGTSNAGAAIKLRSADQSDAVIIDSSQRVGVGTMSPDTLVEIGNAIGTGTANLLKLTSYTNSQSSRPALVFWNNNPNTAQAQISAKGGASYNASKLHFSVANSSRQLADRACIDEFGTFIIGPGETRRNTKGSNQHQVLLIEGTGNNSTRMSMIRNSNDDNGPEIQLIKTRGTSIGSVTKPNQNDYIGSITFLAGDDSDLYSRGADISVQATGTPANDRVPSDLMFSTTPTSGATSPQERLRITSDGKFGFNDNDPERTIDVKGANCMLQLEGTGGNGRQYSLCSADDTTGAAVGTAGQFVIYDDTAGADRLTISSDGQVAVNNSAHHTTHSGILAAHATTSGRFSYKAIEIGATISSGTDQGAIIVGRRKAASSVPSALLAHWDDGTHVTLYHGGGWSTHASTASTQHFYTDNYTTSDNSGSIRLSIGSKGQIYLNNRDSNNNSHRGNIIAYAPPSGEFAYKSLEIGSTNSSSNDTGGLIVAQRKGTTAMPFALLGSWDNGSACTLYLGGGWGSQSANATQLNFYTGSNQGSGGSSGTKRLSIDSNGEAIFYKNVAVGGGHPWAVTSATGYNNLSVSGDSASSSGFLNLGNGAAATNADFDLGRIKFHNGATEVARITATTATSSNNDANMFFATKHHGGSLTTKLTIHDTGGIQIGNTGNVSPFTPTTSGITGGLVLTTPVYSEYHYTWSGHSSYTIDLTCASYFSSEFIYVQHQTNGGSRMQQYARGKWSNNHYQHTLNVWEWSGSGGGLSVSFTASDQSGGGSINGLSNMSNNGSTYSGFTNGGGESNSTTANGRFRISETYNWGSVSSRALIVRCYYGSFAISKS